MQKNGHEFIFSPSDLTTFIESPFASWMARAELENREAAVPRDAADGLLQLLGKRGIEHEIAKLEEFRRQGLSICEISTEGTKLEQLAATESALRSGVDIIYQAYLQLQPFAGYADFLVKVPGVSQLGDWHYEIWDTKLSSVVKPKYILQTCCYAEMVEALQGVLPASLTIALGNGDAESFRTLDYMAYYRAIKRQFLTVQENFDILKRADPGESNRWGDWSEYAAEIFLERDDLNQVATIRKSQIIRLISSGVSTMRALAELDQAADVRGISTSILARLRAQAAVQCSSVGLESPNFTIRAELNQGLALLPPHSAMDIFFDIEGFPLDKGGLEYLWGSSYFEGGALKFIDFWAHNRAQEKECFVEFITWAYARWLQDPSMHIYHYASYEITACRKLMGRFGVCEMEVDQLLRNEVFVDLYKIVKESLTLGESRYSIKNVEKIYRAKRATDVASGGDSVVVYEKWRSEYRAANPGLEPPRSAWSDSADLSGIREYNKDDCDSTHELVGWLREQQAKMGISYVGRGHVVAAPESEELSSLIELRDNLLTKARSEENDVPGSGRISEMLAWLLEFHRRESKPIFWRLFDRRATSPEELFDDLDCIVDCCRTELAPYKHGNRDRSFTYQYRFDPTQECKGQRCNYFIHGSLENSKVEVVSVDTTSGIICLKAPVEPPFMVTLIPDEYIRPMPIPGAIEAVAREHFESASGNEAIMDFLERRAPRISGVVAGQPILPRDDTVSRLTATITAVVAMEGSCLTIQGPPGTGKTYTASHIIAQLMRDGKKVGITSNSHKAINNLMIGAAKLCRNEGIHATFTCTSNTDEQQFVELDVTVTNNAGLLGFVAPSAVIGTTAWGFCRPDLALQFDYLFVDEAGQVSVANLVGMSRAAKNIVLIGDQMQLSQPTQGSHPCDSGMSALDYYMGDRATIPETQGIFLGTTWRMHPRVNQFVSEAIYDGRLVASDSNEEQTILVPEAYDGPLNIVAGLVTVPVEHFGNTQGSDEEVERIAELSLELIGRTMTEKGGVRRVLGWQDILFVAPYNLQVNKLKERLAQLPGGDVAKVGSVDKFQGQEASVVILSMCSSDANETARGLEFLFDERRLNVAISRAKCLAIVVANPTLALSRVSTPSQMKKVNILSRIFEAT